MLGLFQGFSDFAGSLLWSQWLAYPMKNMVSGKTNVHKNYALFKGLIQSKSSSTLNRIPG